MKKVFLLSAFCMAISCNNDLDDTSCAITDPTKDLQWLKEDISAMEADTSELAKFFFIEQANYKGQSVFVYSNCCPICNTVVNVFNCRGELLGRLYAEVPVEEISNSKIVFKRQDSPCE